MCCCISREGVREYDEQDSNNERKIDSEGCYGTPVRIPGVSTEVRIHDGMDETAAVIVMIV